MLPHCWDELSPEWKNVINVLACHNIMIVYLSWVAILQSMSQLYYSDLKLGISRNIGRFWPKEDVEVTYMDPKLDMFGILSPEWKVQKR